MTATARSTISTLGVILGVCLAPLDAMAQSVPNNGAPPTAGFADPTPEEQRVLRGDSTLGGGSASTAVPYTAPASAAFTSPPPSRSPAPAYAAPAPAYAAPGPAYAGPAYGNAAPPRYTYTAPAQYGRSAPPTSTAYGYGGTATGDARADDGGGGASKDKAQKEEHFRIGVLGGVGFPRPLALEAMIKLERMWGLGLEYSTTPTIQISGTDTSFYAIAATFRVFPFKDGFFLGMRAGRQHLGGEGNVTVAPYGSFRESVTVDTTFFNPRIGFLATWPSGISLGIDAGVQIPISATVASTLPAGVGIDEDVKKVAERIGNSPLPTIDLLKVGFLL